MFHPKNNKTLNHNKIKIYIVRYGPKTNKSIIYKQMSVWSLHKNYEDEPTIGYTTQNDKDVPLWTDLFTKISEDILL